jgi:hypothetical protein
MLRLRSSFSPHPHPPLPYSPLPNELNTRKHTQKQTAFDTRELEAMKAEELREVATIVTRKLWQNRRVLALTTNRLAAVAVLQTLDRSLCLAVCLSAARRE